MLLYVLIIAIIILAFVPTFYILLLAFFVVFFLAVKKYNNKKKEQETMDDNIEKAPEKVASNRLPQNAYKDTDSGICMMGQHRCDLAKQNEFAQAVKNRHTFEKFVAEELDENNNRVWWENDNLDF